MATKPAAPLATTRPHDPAQPFSGLHVATTGRPKLTAFFESGQAAGHGPHVAAPTTYVAARYAGDWYAGATASKAVSLVVFVTTQPITAAFRFDGYPLPTDRTFPSPDRFNTLLRLRLRLLPRRFHWHTPWLNLDLS